MQKKENCKITFLSRGIAMTKMEQRLRDLCMNNSEYESKYHQYENVVSDFVDKLRVVPVYFPHFSKHDSSHSQNIIKYIGMLLGEQRINKLSVSDLLVFLLRDRKSVV